MEVEKTIIEVERLLSHIITGKSFILDGKGGLIEIDKDNISLYNELGDINKKLDALYDKGEITLKQKVEMQAAVKRKYEMLIEKAPKKEVSPKERVETSSEREESRFGEVLKGMGVDKEALFRGIYPNEDISSDIERRNIENPNETVEKPRSGRVR